MADSFLGTLRVDLAAYTAKFTEGLAKGNRDLDRFLGKFSKKSIALGKSLSVGLTAPLLGAAAAAVKAADAIDKVERSVAVATGLQGAALQAVKMDLEEVAKSTPAALDAVGSAIGTFATQTGESGESLQRLAMTAVEASNLLGEDLGQNVTKSGRIIKQFGLTADEGADFIAQLFRLSQDYDVALSKQLDTIQAYGAVLSNANIPLEEQAVLFAKLEGQGIAVSRVMPGINASLRRAAAAGLDLNKFLRDAVTAVANATTEVEALDTATRIFGAEGAARLTVAIRNGSFAFDDFGTSATAAAEDVMRFAEENRTLGERATILGRQLQYALAPLGEVLLDIIERLTPFISRFAEWLAVWIERFAALPPPIQLVAVGFGTFLALLGPGAIAVGVFAKSLIVLKAASFQAGKAIGFLFSNLTRFITVPLLTFGLGVFLEAEIKAVEKWGAEMIGAIDSLFAGVGFAIDAAIPFFKRSIADFALWVLDQVEMLITETSDLLGDILDVLNPALGAGLTYATNIIENGAIKGIRAGLQAVSNAADEELKEANRVLEARMDEIGATLNERLEEIEKKFGNTDRPFGEAFAAELKDLLGPALDIINSTLRELGLTVDDLEPDLKEVVVDLQGMADAAAEAGDGFRLSTDEIQALIDKLSESGKKMKGVGKDANDAADEIEISFGQRALDAIEGWSRGVSSELARFAVDSEGTFDDVLKSFVRMLFQMTIQQAIFAPLLSGFGSFFGIFSAKGNVFSGGNLIPFAQGGVVSRPTLFPMSGRNTGVMGEAGPEGILPLARTSGGDLGVRLAGGGVTINLIDQRRSGEVDVQEREGPGGSRVLEIMIRDEMKKNLGNGSLDGAMGGAYGLRRTGVGR